MALRAAGAAVGAEQLDMRPGGCAYESLSRATELRSGADRWLAFARRGRSPRRSAYEGRVSDDRDFSRWQDAEFLKLQFAKLIDGLRLFYGQS